MSALKLLHRIRVHLLLCDKKGTLIVMIAPLFQCLHRETTTRGPNVNTHASIRRTSHPSILSNTVHRNMDAYRAKSDIVAMVTLMVVLAITSLSTFAWMASIGWTDHTGIAVAVIFVLLTLLQGVAGVGWWTATNKSSPAQQSDVLSEQKELTPIVA